ncbi:MAG: glycosyltransferase family 9 protein [Oligoflexia bacterium]|nr:glycosyltransferase family 9 protein [Oligoflexia bacterium]
MKIVIRMPNWLGDIVMSIPFLYALAITNTKSSLILIIREEYAPLFEYLNFKKKIEIITFNKKRYSGISGPFRFVRDYRFLSNADIYYTLSTSFSSALIGWLLKIKSRIGYSSDLRRLLLTKSFTFSPFNQNMKHRSQEYMDLLLLPTLNSFNIFPDDIIKVRNEINDGDEYYLINATSEAPSRRMPIQKWVELITQFQNTRFIFSGLEKDFSYIEALIVELTKNNNNNNNQYINLAGKTDLRKLILLISKATYIISNDSGVAHLASLLSKPLVVFFGAGDPNNTAPISYNNRNVNNHNIRIEKLNIPCSPCLKNYCSKKDSSAYMNCLKNLNLNRQKLNL